MLITIWFILKNRNAERRIWIAEQAALGDEGHGLVEKRNENGELVKERVDVSFMDLTDHENKFFIYPL